MQPVRIACLCPTYCRPRMLEISKQCFRDQFATGISAGLVVDDEHVPGGADPEFGSLPAKYNRMARCAIRRSWIDGPPDILCVWEDDDIYLPDHLSRIAAAWDNAGRPAEWWGHPSHVYSDYPGHVVTEPATGRFHAAVALTYQSWMRCPWIETKRADFDQQWMAALREMLGPPCDYLAGGHPTYVFRWHTAHHHGQSSMRDPADETWYERAREVLRQQAENDTGPITPGYDDRAREILRQVYALRGEPIPSTLH